MLARILTLLLLLIMAAILWFINANYYPHDYIQSGFYSLVVYAAIYFLFKMLLEEVIVGRIADHKARYSFRKAVSIAYLVVLIVSIITIWVPNPEALLVAYGLVAAGIAISLQDLFKNIAGGFMLFLTKLYRVGDRIEVGSRFGDVIDIDIMYTMLLEIRSWVDGDQATGRVIAIPNSLIITSAVINYTKDNEFIWDEIQVPVTYDSDWKGAAKMMVEIASKETQDIEERARKEISAIQEKYYLSKREVRPQVYPMMTDNWIMLSLRYVANVRSRRPLNARLHALILERIEKSKKIKVASATFDIVGFPEVKVKR